MAISNFTSGKVNRYGDEVYIASNAFQFMVTFIVSQFIITLNQINKCNSVTSQTQNNLLNKSSNNKSN